MTQPPTIHSRRATVCMVAALLVAAVALVPRPAGAADPSQRWRTITTPHFYVHYYRSKRHDLVEVGRKVARAAEKAHAVLAPLLRHSPSSRTHVVVTDDTDGANGSAQIIPMNIIRVYVTGPGSLSTLNDYDDWLYGLLLHEYTHILHIDTIHGLASIVNVVLGKSWAPNQIQPRWFIEGLAVYGESSRTGGGRNRNALYDMYLRSAVLEERLLEMDQISSSTRYFPRGTVPYLYGSRFVAYLAERYGEDKLSQMSHDYGGSTIPYGINRVAKRALGRTFVELYDEFRGYLERRYALQKSAAEARGLTPYRAVTNQGEHCASPRYSADGTELVYVENDGRSQTKITVLDVATGAVKEQYDSFGGSGVDITPDGRHLVYGQSATWETYYQFQDIRVRDRRGGEVRQLTSGLRARDPAVSPDGSHVAFTTSELGSMSLAVIPFQGGAHRVLYAGSDGDQIHSPRWSPDGQQIVYSRWRSGGNRDIYLMDVETRVTRRLTSDRALDTDPVFSADGRRIYFSSDRTGIFNVFALDVGSRQLWQVTNVLGCALVPAVSADGRKLFYVGFSTKGFDLHAADLEPEQFMAALPYVNDRPAPPQVPRDELYPERDYSPLRTVYPRAWKLSLGSDAFGSLLGIEIAGGDVVGRHAYSIITNVGLESAHLSYGLSYTYSRLWPHIHLDTARYVGPRGGVRIDGVKRTYTEENYGLGASLGLPVLRIPDHAVSINVGYRANWFRDADDTSVVVEPGMLSPRLPEVGLLAGATAGIRYRSVRRFAHSISNESGRSIGIGLRVDHPDLGSDFESTQFTYDWTEYIPIPWFDDHVLALRVGGGIAGGNLTRRGVFFIGGFPEQDVLQAVIDATSLGGVFLRGYPQGVVHGDQYHLMNVEYRLPLLDIERGFSSLPLYFNYIHMAAFTDAGNAFFGELDLSDLRVGVGAELMVEAVIGYYLPASFRIGYARGLMEDGGNQWHFLLGNQF